MTIQDKVRGYKRGSFWTYIENYKVYHCPGDSRHTMPPTDPLTGFTNTIGGYRSYSMGAPLSQWALGATFSGESLVVVKKLTEFVRPGSKVVWLEEADGYGWNHRTWNMYLNQYKWYDPFAIWHNDASTFGFADGHAERRKWVEEITIQISELQDKSLQPFLGPDNEDYNWFKKAYVPGHMPEELKL